MNLRQRPLLAGAAALFVAGVANRIIGTVYRVLLVRSAGEEAIGLLQMTWPVYRVAWTLATAGLFVGIAKLSADALGSRNTQAARVYARVGLGITLVTSCLAAALLFLTRHLFANHFLTDPRTLLTLSVFPLLLIPAAFSHSLRGVLQGQERLAPVAFSGVIEAASRVPIVLLLVAWLLPYGAAWTSAGIAVGLIIGELLSVLYLAWVVRRSWEKLQPSHGSPGAKAPASVSAPAAAGALGALALPVLISGLINGILGMFNVALIPRQLLAAGFEPSEATILYGRLFGMALPVLHMPMVAIHPIAHAAVPAVAKRIAEGRTGSVRRLLSKCFWASAAVSALASASFWLYGEEIGRLLYDTEGLGSLIAPLAVAAPFAYVGHVASGVLYGLGRTGITMTNTMLGNLLRLGLVYALVADPRWGIAGALWAVVADYALTAVLNVASIAVLMRKGSSKT